MKKNLNFFYKQKYIHIILTIVLSTIVTLWRSLYTNLRVMTAEDLKYNYAARISDKSL